MAVKKTAKGTAGRMKRKAASGKKTVSKAAKSVKKAVSKSASGAAKRAKKVVSNPRRTVRRAAENIHQSASRAREFGDTVVTTGELIKETAEFVDSMSQRAKSRVTKTGSRKTR